VSLNICAPRCSHEPITPSHRTITSIGIAVIGVACVLVPIISWFISAAPSHTWYANLAKPVWTPAEWLFGPVWSCLYLAMTMSAIMVWLERDREDVCGPLGLFGVQLGANLAWCIFFFTLRSPVLGMLDLAVCWFAIAATIVEFYRVNKLAGVLLAPYLLWVTYAGAVNAEIMAMNW